MNRSAFAFTAWIILTIPLWGQHSGHPAEPSVPQTSRQPATSGAQTVPVRDAVSATQALYRELEKNARRWHETRFHDVMARYEASIDALARSIDAAAPGDRDYGKNLELAIRSLDRQYQQLENLASTGSPEAVDSLNRVIDAVALARDEALAQQAAFQESDSRGHTQQGSGTHQSGGHGCGGARKILRRIPGL